MRTRSRTLNRSVTGLKSQVYKRTYKPGLGTDFQTVSISKITDTLTERSETISDQSLARPEVYVDPKTLKWRRRRYPTTSRYLLSSDTRRVFGSSRVFRPVQPCTHTKTVILEGDTAGEFVVVCASDTSSSWHNEWTLTYENSLIGARNLTGASSVNSMLAGATKNYTAGAFPKIDWFALTHDFTEACESFTKNKFLAGEALYECEIFVSAFRFITNPASALSTLAKYIRHGLHPRQAEKYRRMTLGGFSRHIRGLGKKAVDAHLSWDFAVKPAIQDTIATLSAHDFVSRRMAYLSSHSGSYIPIRVRQELSASSSNTVPGGLSAGVRSKIFTLCDNKKSLGVISAWGRVRQDLDWNDTWSAYLQYFGVGKIIGLAWELIPFSFVVDWVTDAQEYIDNYTRLRTGGPFASIRNLSASLKEYTEESLWLNPGYEPSIGAQIGNPVGPVKIARRHVSTYSRSPTIPETSGVVDFSSLGLFHYTKIGELTFQLWNK